MRVTRLSLAGAIGATYPNAANTGASLPASLYAISNGVAATAGSAVAAGFAGNTGWTWSGTTWSYSGGTAQLNSLSIPVELDITASNTVVTGCQLAYVVVAESGGTISNTIISNCAVVASHGINTSLAGIKLGGGGANVPLGVLIQGCTINGSDSTTNRLAYGIDDPYGTAANTTILGCDIHWMRTGTSPGGSPNMVIQDCYIHDFGYQSGDHSDGIDFEGSGTTGSLYIVHNTILNQMTQTAAIHQNSTANAVQNVTIDRNLFAGGSYDVYGGDTSTEQHNDTNCVTTNGQATVTDGAASTAYIGYSVTGTGVPALTSIIGAVPDASYAMSAPATASGTVTLTLETQFASRIDPLSSISGGTILSDYALNAGDVGASVTVTGAGGVPASPLTTITAVTAVAAAGVAGTATLSQVCTNGSVTATLHYTANVVITNNRFTTVYFPNSGDQGPVADFDQYGVGNIWTNNVYHETGAAIPA